MKVHSLGYRQLWEITSGSSTMARIFERSSSLSESASIAFCIAVRSFTGPVKHVVLVVPFASLICETNGSLAVGGFKPSTRRFAKATEIPSAMIIGGFGPHWKHSMLESMICRRANANQALRNVWIEQNGLELSLRYALIIC